MNTPEVGLSEHSPSRKSPFGLCAVICAALLLLALDLWLAVAHPLARLPVASLERSEIYQSVHSFLKQETTPDVVLFGSSLLTAPVLQSETLYLGQPIPKFVHRRCHLLEEDLAGKLGRQPQVFCLAAGGEMASDAYLMTKNILSTSRQPIAIVYGVAPRDFQDNLVPGLESTPTFQTMATVGDLPDRLQSPPFDLQKKLDLVFGRLSTMWRYKTDIRVYLNLRLKKYMERLLPWVCFEKYDENHELKKQKRGTFPEEAAGEPTAWPGVALDHFSSEQTLAEYRKRYNPVSQQMVDTEFDYFERLFQLCRERGIAVLVVNMPLSTTNKSLMQSGFYQSYLKRAQSICKMYDVDFADLNCPPWDSADNFVDTVHLEPRLSARFLQELASITARSQVALSLRSHGQTVSDRSSAHAL